MEQHVSGKPIDRMIISTTTDGLYFKRDWVDPLEQLPLLKVLVAPSGMWTILPKGRKPHEVDEGLPNPDMEMLLGRLPNLRLIFKRPKRHETPRAIVIWQEPEEMEIDFKRLNPTAEIIEAGRVGLKRWRLLTGIGEDTLERRVWRILEARGASNSISTCGYLTAFAEPLDL